MFWTVINRSASTFRARAETRRRVSYASTLRDASRTESPVPLTSTVEIYTLGPRRRGCRACVWGIFHVRSIIRSGPGRRNFHVFFLTRVSMGFISVLSGRPVGKPGRKPDTSSAVFLESSPVWPGFCHNLLVKDKEHLFTLSRIESHDNCVLRVAAVCCWRCGSGFRPIECSLS